MKRRTLVTLAAATPLLALTRPAFAHHGWNWTNPETFELTGTLSAIYIGNPHATLNLDVDGVNWLVELAPLARTLASGFDEDKVAMGDLITAFGNRSSDPNEARMKAVRIVVGETVYDVYPDRVHLLHLG